MAWPHDARFVTAAAGAYIPSGLANAQQDAVLSLDRFAAATVLSSTAAAIYGDRRGDWVCDGTDDQVQIQAAIDAAAAAGGGVVLLSEGQFTVDGSASNKALDIKDNVTLMGHGTATTIVVHAAITAGQNVIVANGTDSWRICDITINCNGTSHALNVTGIYAYNTAEGWTIDRVKVVDAQGTGIWGNGIYLDDAQGTIVDVIAGPNDEAGLKVSSSNTTGVSVRNLYAGGGAYGVYDEGTYTRLVDCIAPSCTTAGYYLDGPSTQVTACLAVECYRGFYIAGTNVSLSNCKATLCDREGFYFDGFQTAKLVGCTVHGSGRAAHDSYPQIYLTNGDGCVITGGCTATRSAVGNQPSYAVTIDNGTAPTNVYVYGNYLNSGVSGTFSDAGGNGKTIPEWIGSGAAANVQNTLTVANR